MILAQAGQWKLANKFLPVLVWINSANGVKNDAVETGIELS